MNTRRAENGVALVISLAFIVMLTIVVVGLLESMRTDRPAAGTYQEKARAAQFAQSGVEQVIGTLQQLTADTNRNWISGPGQIVVGAATDNTTTTVDERKVLTYAVPLSSGSAGALPPGATSTTGVYQSPNLNIPALRDPTTYLIAETADSAPVKLPVDWIYVTQDGILSRKLEYDAGNVNAVPPVPPAYIWKDNTDNADPAKNFNPNPTTNPVVGRYAYWADDESSKINYNIAWGRDAASVNAKIPTGSPTKIDLTALPGFSTGMADALHNYITNNNSTTLPYLFFNTPVDARKLETQAATTGISQVLQNNKFEVTHYSQDPNTTFFNEPRIVLTTHPANAGWTYNSTSKQWVGTNGKPWPDGRPRYIRILQDPETVDPGSPYTSSIDPVKLNDTILTLALRPAATGVTAGYLQRTDWPMVDGKGSFQSKYYGGYSTAVGTNGISAQTSRLGEMAINIIDYVRAKESAKQVITPIIGSFNTATSDQSQWFQYTGNASSQNAYIGLTRMPCINELGAWYGTATTAINPPAGVPIAVGDRYYIFKIEIFLPLNYGLSSVDLSQFYLTIQGAAKMDTPTAPTNYHGSDIHKIYADEMDTGSTILTAGHYAVISRAVRSTYAATDTRPSTTGAHTKFLLEGGILNTNYQIAPANDGLTSGLPIDTDATIQPGAITSLEVNDPRLNAHPGDWVHDSTGSANTFGAQNYRFTKSVGHAPPSTLPEVDTDGGLVSVASLYMPAPYGTKYTRTDGTIDDNSSTGSNGQVSSVGELGYIHTGFEPCAQFVDASGSTVAIPPGTSWRTLRLQPNQYPDTSVIPDWALMDLFTAPVQSPTAYNKYVYAPHDNGFGGRVNANSMAQPFGLARTVPLAAVLVNCTYDSTDPTKTVDSTLAQTLANNIYNHTLATSTPANKWYGYPKIYNSPGQVIEIKGIADGGEKSEELVRQMANLVTNRGNVFSVYTVGQSIKQTATGTYIVTGEQRLQAMVERYFNYNTTDATKTEVRFAPVYYRNLTP